jgi:hypothetical protein
MLLKITIKFPFYIIYSANNLSYYWNNKLLMANQNPEQLARDKKIDIGLLHCDRYRNNRKSFRK